MRALGNVTRLAADTGSMTYPEDISRYKAQLRDKQRGLRDLLGEWDPIGIIGADGEPRDEYDCFLGVIGDLRAGISELKLSRYFEDRLRSHFGLDRNQPGRRCLRVASLTGTGGTPSRAASSRSAVLGCDLGAEGRRSAPREHHVTR